MGVRVSGCGNPSGRVYGRFRGMCRISRRAGPDVYGSPGVSSLLRSSLRRRVFRLAPAPPLFRARGVNGPEKVLLKNVILEILRLKKRSDLSK